MHVEEAVVGAVTRKPSIHIDASNAVTSSDYVQKPGNTHP